MNWDALDPEELFDTWAALDAWVTWLRRTYGLPASVVPPLWHRHTELVWELSALHISWVAAYSPQQHPTAPLAWHRDFADAIERLRDWTPRRVRGSTATGPPARPIGPVRSDRTPRTSRSSPSTTATPTSPSTSPPRWPRAAAMHAPTPDKSPLRPVPAAKLTSA